MTTFANASDATSLVTGVLAHERRALAKAITLVESTRADHQAQARQLLDALLPHTGKSLRIGISGVPGVGKSTFIESFGLALTTQKHRVAVLAIDPSSSLGGGSILGDKTRMDQLAIHPAAFIRPSPAAGSMGGVAARTREALLVCEAAGFDVVIVETVGVGQSEAAVAGMTDIFVLLQLPNAGDELQAMKKGVIELADIVVVNKADLNAEAAALAARQIGGVLSLLRPASANWTPRVLTMSGKTGAGIAELWQAILSHRDALDANGEREQKRRGQARAWMWNMIEAGLHTQFREHPTVRGALQALSANVSAGQTSASAAAAQLLQLFQNKES